MVYEVETIKRQAKLRSVSWSWASLWAWPVTWPAPLKSRYVTWGALQVLYAFAFALLPAHNQFSAF